MSVVALPEIELVPGDLAIADLHLDTALAEGSSDFAAFADAIHGARTLLVLGDLFDVWVGAAQERMPGAPAVLDALARLAQRGTQVVVVPGNRDFLLDRSFEARTGARLCPEGCVARSGSQRWLVVHGDTLCTKDTGYQRLRRVLRSPVVLGAAPHVPLWAATRIARRLRRASVKSVLSKLPDEKSIQSEAALAAARAHRCDLVLCGHAHAFRDERLAGGVRLVVLDAFGGARDTAEVARDGTLGARSSSLR